MISECIYLFSLLSTGFSNFIICYISSCQGAEYFLGVTADDFQLNSDVRLKIENKLKELCNLEVRVVREGVQEGVKEVVKEVVRTMEYTLNSYQPVIKKYQRKKQTETKIFLSKTRIEY